ncbi:NKAP domain containing 1 [Rhinolophus ferrumequinum]|uniref:NKAP domain containing 1 n=1 Tax=Rhinolophus ferrumequinum TaxID=59479 RepID=A0A7J7W8U1_RHIFE|nr:NKAP domain containing 1 [Rhinolophus ferrumequinum]
MSRVPLGKVLLRNVIRHTDAHNKIQEESDMWKIRELEKQMEDAYRGTKRKMLPSSSSRMRSDGFDEETQRDYWRPKSEISGALEDNFLKAKSWNKKLYDYEADMPDRWGHSGYKELYPEEFETDSSDQQDITNGKKTSPQVKSSTHESHKHKKSKKSHKKKQKKKSHKKQKKSKKEAIDIMADSSSEFSEETGASSTRKQPHKRKKKSRKKSLKKSALVLEAESDTSQSGDSASSSSEKSEERDTKKTKRKKRDKKIHIPVVNNEIQERTNKRTNWKVATDERSAESSEDD